MAPPSGALFLSLTFVDQKYLLRIKVQLSTKTSFVRFELLACDNPPPLPDITVLSDIMTFVSRSAVSRIDKAPPSPESTVFPEIRQSSNVTEVCSLPASNANAPPTFDALVILVMCFYLLKLRVVEHRHVFERANIRSRIPSFVSRTKEKGAAVDSDVIDEARVCNGKVDFADADRA